VHEDSWEENQNEEEDLANLQRGLERRERHRRNRSGGGAPAAVGAPAAAALRKEKRRGGARDGEEVLLVLYRVEGKGKRRSEAVAELGRCAINGGGGSVEWRGGAVSGRGKAGRWRSGSAAAP
jgi:hypothetical protein